MELKPPCKVPGGSPSAAGFWEQPLSWAPSLAVVGDSWEGELCPHKDITEHMTHQTEPILLPPISPDIK